MAVNRPIEPTPTNYADLNKIISNLYKVLDDAVQAVNAASEAITDLDERVAALEGDTTEEINGE